MKSYVVVITTDVKAVREALHGIVPEAHIADVPVNPEHSRFYSDTRSRAQDEHTLAVEGCRAVERYLQWATSQMRGMKP